MITIITQTNVPWNQIASLFCSAVEGPMSSWLLKVGPVLPTEDECKQAGIQNFYADTPFFETDGFRMLFRVEDPEGDGKQTKDVIVNKDGIQRALQLMADKHRRHFLDLIDQNDDAITADVFAQLCVYGEVIFD